MYSNFLHKGWTAELSSLFTASEDAAFSSSASCFRILPDLLFPSYKISPASMSFLIKV